MTSNATNVIARVALVADFTGLQHAVATFFAEYSSNRTTPTRLDVARASATITSSRVSVVAGLGALLDSVAAALTADTLSWAYEPRLHSRTVRGTPVASNGIVVITRFAAFDDSVAAGAADPTGCRAGKTDFDRSATAITAIAGKKIAVVANLVNFSDSIAALFAPLARFRTLEPRLDCRARGVTAVASSSISVVTGFVRIYRAASTELARFTVDWASPTCRNCGAI